MKDGWMEVGGEGTEATDDRPYRKSNCYVHTFKNNVIVLSPSKISQTTQQEDVTGELLLLYIMD